MNSTLLTSHGLRLIRGFAVLLIAVGGSASAAGPGEISYLGEAHWPGDARDLSGLQGALEDGSPQDRLGGLGSGIAWTGKGNRYLMIPDRGAGDGAVSYRCRYHTVEVNVTPNAQPPVSLKLTGTTLLSGPQGQPLVGLSKAIRSKKGDKSLRFDPEAIRLTPQGTVLVADEYGPTLREFRADGAWCRDWPVPAAFGVQEQSGDPAKELPPHNAAGRQANRGFEGMAITPGGAKVVAMLQGPLLQDGALDAENKRIGRHVRLWVGDRTGQHSKQFVYRLEDPAFGCNEIEAISHDEYLVIERDGKEGLETKGKRIYKIDLRGATDVSNVAALPAETLPPSIRPVKKSLYLDLLDPQWGLAGESFPEKIEGIALGPKLADGRRLFLATSDNDFRPDHASHVYAFAVPLP